MLTVVECAMVPDVAVTVTTNVRIAGVGGAPPAAKRAQRRLLFYPLR
jgi:hypothetical protein